MTAEHIRTVDPDHYAELRDVVTEDEAHAERLTYALTVLEPWVQAAKAIGVPELTRVMEEALAKAEAEWERALSALAEAEAAA